VHSENVVRVLDYGALDDASPYLVMELLDGRDLFAELRARGPLPVGEACEILVQACEGVASVHAAGIVHRDLKPANLFLTRRRNGSLLVKIVDFGISKTPKATEEELSLTRGSLGSPQYMSPEQLRSARGVDGRSDVWSLGVTLHRALTGELPFADESIGGLMAAIMTEDPRPIREARPDLPPELDEVVRRCLAKNVEERFANVLELADALMPFVMPSASGGPRTRSSPPSSGDAPRALPYLHESTAGAHVSSVEEMPSTAGEPGRRLTLALAIAVPLALAAATIPLVTIGGSRAPASALATAPAAAKDAGQGIAVSDLPAPKTDSPEAAAAYRAAIQAVRDGSLVVAADAFQRAAAADPSMAAAELRGAIYGAWLAGSDTRKHGRAAIALRSSLSDRDGDVLTALEPLYVSPHPDAAEAGRRLDVLVTQRPNDAELLLIYTMVLLDRREPSALQAMCDRMLTLDPRFAGAAWMAALLAEDTPRTMRAVDRCLAIAPSAASCLRIRATREETDGDCAALETDARRMVAMEGASRRAYEFLALALFARGRPIDSVREALRLKWKATPESSRDEVRDLDEARLDIAIGDFGAALAQTEALAAVAERTESRRARREAVLLEVALRTELGQPAEAAKVADAYLRRMGAWSESDAIEDDPRPRLYAAAVRGAVRSADEREAALRDWVTAWTTMSDPLDRARVWVEGFAAPAETQGEAVQALAALPQYEPLPRLLMGSWTTPYAGKVYALAGRPADAIPVLRSVTTSCRSLEWPSEVIGASYHLGDALEGVGDQTGACAEYRKVADVWGKDKRSVTGAAARARLAAKCGG
jgi:serine/threonine-protein kinase